MLVIISDLHFTDGTTGISMPAGAFSRFREYIRDQAYDASWRTDGRYEPIDVIDLVLLGDIFDIIRSTKWTDDLPGSPDFARPWDDPATTPALARKVDVIVDAIITQNALAFGILRGLSTDDPITLPLANEAGSPQTERAPINTRVHYMVGNHDWMLHLAHHDFELIRKKIKVALGLANPDGPFPHDPSESEILSRVLGQHRVMARHGDIHDPFNYPFRAEETGRDAASLGDAIVIEIINRFPHEVRRQLASELPADFVSGMDELANVRPSLLAPVWINSLTNRHKLSDELADKVKAIWNGIADDAMQLPFIREQDTWHPFDVVDLLQYTLSFSKLLSFESIADLVSWIEQKIWGGDTSFAEKALAEQAFKDRSAKYFIYGHTHHQEMVPLDMTLVDGEPYEQTYFNSGTWHPLHEPTIHNPRQNSFFQYKVLTYLTFYKGDERKGREYETWSGRLDD